MSMPDLLYHQSIVDGYRDHAIGQVLDGDTVDFLLGNVARSGEAR